MGSARALLSKLDLVSGFEKIGLVPPLLRTIYFTFLGILLLPNCPRQFRELKGKCGLTVDRRGLDKAHIRTHPRPTLLENDPKRKFLVYEMGTAEIPLF